MKLIDKPHKNVSRNFLLIAILPITKMVAIKIKRVIILFFSSGVLVK